MTGTKLELQTNGIRIRDLDIRSKVVSDHLAAVPEEERELLFTQAAEIGVFCLERAGNARDLEFVPRADPLVAAQTPRGAAPRELPAAAVDLDVDGRRRLRLRARAGTDEERPEESERHRGGDATHRGRRRGDARASQEVPARTSSGFLQRGGGAMNLRAP